MRELRVGSAYDNRLVVCEGKHAVCRAVPSFSSQRHLCSINHEAVVDANDADDDTDSSSVCSSLYYQCSQFSFELLLLFISCPSLAIFLSLVSLFIHSLRLVSLPVTINTCLPPLLAKAATRNSGRIPAIP